MKSSPRHSASRSSPQLSRRLIAAVALTLAGQVHAAPETWVGNVSPNWNDLNWSGVNPVPVAGDSLIFGVAGSAGSILNNNLAAGLSIVGINFNAGASAYTFNGNALTLAGNVVNGSVSLQTINLDLALTGLRTFTTTTGGGNVRLGGVLSGTGGVVKAGAGTLALANTGNTFTGELNIGPGIVNVASVLDYGAPSSIGARLQAQETAVGSGIGLHFTGGTLQYTGATPQSTNREIRILNGVTGGAIDASGTTPAATLSFTHTGANTNLFDTAGTRTLTLTGTNTGDNSFSILLTDQAASMTTLQKTGAGKWLIANSDNTYTGETIFGPGILNVASVSDYGVASSIGARSVFNEVSTTVTGIGLHFAGGTLQYTGSTPQSTNRNIRVLTGNGATIDASGSNPGATLSFTKTGANLNLFDTAGVRTFTLTGSNTGDNGFSIQLTNQGANVSNLVKSGVGTWVLNGPDSNFATGTTTVTSGTLVLAKNNALSVNGSLIIGSGANTAVARLGGLGGDQIANTSTLTFSGTGGILRMNNLHETVGGLVSAVGSGIVENESGVAGTSTFTVNSTATQSFGGTLRNGDGIGTDGVLAFTKAGTGTLTLAGANTHTGATTVGGGTLTITGSLGAGTTTTITNSTVNGAGMIQGAVNVGPGGVLATSGMVGGTVNINSLGRVNATGTFAGPMNIASVGTLSGTSTINGVVTAVDGARISPGSATTPGTLNVGSLTLESGAVINAEFGATSDFINVTEATGLTLNGGSFNVFATGGVAPLTANGSYTLLDYEGALIGTSANLSIANAQFGKTYTVVDDMVNTLLTLTITDDTNITEWNGLAGDGLWPNPGNWSTGAPNGVGTAALLGLIPTQPTIIDLSGPITVGGIRFQNTMSYTLSGDGLSGDHFNLDNGDAAAVIELITGNHTIAAPVVLAGDVNLAPATGTTLTVTGSISGAHGLTQTTAGTVILTGTNSYTRTSVDAGTLQIGDGGTSGSLGSGDVTIASGATLVLNRSDDLAVANNIVGLGTLTKNALNTVTLTGANVFAALNVNSGTIKVGSTGALSQVTAATINGGSLDLNEIDTTIGALSGSGGVITDNGGLATTTTLTVNQASSTTYNGTIEEGAGQTVALTKIGAGTLTLAGTGANTYAGLTTITEGALTLAKTGVNAIVGNVQIGDASGSDFLNLGASDQIADASVLTFTAGNSGNSAFFHLNGFNETVQGITTTVGNAAVIANNNASIASVLTVDTQGNNYTYDGIIRNGAAGTMGLTKAGAGRLTLANTVTVATTSYTGATTINGGQLVLEDLTAFSSPITNNVAVTDSLIFNQSTRDGTATGVINGPGGLTKNGPNTLTLTGVNSFTGDFVLNDGTFGIGANGAQGGGTIVINGGIIRASGAARALPNPVTVNGSFILGRLTDLNGSITLNANATITASNFDGVANNNSLLGPVSGGFRLTLAEGAGGIFSPFGLGTGALVVNAVNTNSGGTTIASGRVNVAAAGALANAPLAVNGGILNLNNPAQTVTLFEGTGGTVNFIAGHVLTVDQAGDSSVTSAIAGPGTLIKDGAGALTLSGPQSYSALTTEGGTTTLTTSLPNATLTNNDGTLNLNASATSSVVNVNDTVNFGSNQRLAGLNIGVGGVATILSAAPGAPVFEGFESDGFASDQTINNSVAAVPEPGALSLLAAGALGLLGRRRRPVR